MSKRMKFVAILAVVGIFAIGFTTLSFAQSGVKPGDQPAGEVSKDTQGGAKSQKTPASSFGTPQGIKGSNPSGDLSKSGVTATPPEKKSSSFGVPLGVKGSNPSGDLSGNAVPATPTKKGSSSFGVSQGIKGSNPSGDLSTNATGGGK